MSSEDGSRLFHTRGARAAHRAIRESGRVPGADATAKRVEYLEHCRYGHRPERGCTCNIDGYNSQLIKKPMRKIKEERAKWYGSPRVYRRKRTSCYGLRSHPDGKRPYAATDTHVEPSARRSGCRSTVACAYGDSRRNAALGDTSMFGLWPTRQTRPVRAGEGGISGLEGI